MLQALTGSSTGSLPSLLRARAAATPDAPFLHWQGSSWSYSDAICEAERFAAFLREIGASGRPNRVASYLGNCPEALWTWFGTLFAGAVYVPLNRTHRGSLLNDMLARSGAVVLVTDAEGCEEVGDFEANHVRMLVVVGGAPLPIREVDTVDYASAADSSPWTGVDPSAYELGTVMYTSGSTGRSKAVMISHNQHPRSGALVAEAFGLEPADVWHGWMPVYHVMGQVYAVIASIVAGCSVSLQPRFSRSDFWRQVDQDSATLIGGLASVMRLLWTLPDEGTGVGSSVRIALVSGAFGDLHRAFERRYGLTILDCFGMTEAEPLTLPLRSRLEPGSHGLESPDFEVEILDADDMRVPVGTVGEIAARPRRPGVIFQGYEGDAEQTVRSWKSLWFHTGDLGFLDADGFLHFMDRRKYGIRRKGENISTWELERMLHTAPGVSLAVAVGIENAPGEEDVKIVVVRKPDSEVTARELYDWCVATMASFMVPRYIEFAETLPELTLGKVDRAQLGTITPGVWDATRTDAR